MSLRTQRERLTELRRLMILDSKPERDFDEVTQTIANRIGVPITMINLLDESRDWFKSCVGLSVSESLSTISFCEQFLDSDVPYIVSADTTKDKRFAQNPFVTGEPHIRFYAGARLVANGHTIGTLCAYDFAPRDLNEGEIEALLVMAAAVVDMLGKRAQTTQVPRS